MTLREFWPQYLALHSRWGTQRLHVFGLILGYALAIAGVLKGEWWAILLAPMSAYFFGFLGHLLVEENQPASFRHPILSVACDHLLTWKVLRGQL